MSIDFMLTYLPVVVTLLLLFIFRYSIPFVWTARVWWPYVKVRVTTLSSRIRRFEHRRAASAVARSTSSSTTTTTSERVLSAQGCDPFADSWTWQHRATLDDCDFMGHLSNSSYPKNLDVARMDFAAHRLYDFLQDGGWIALGSSSFQFHQEIPLLTSYSVVSRIETWNDKWLYLKNEFRGGKRKNGEPIVFCTSITKHCFKYGRKTIAPWFVLAYCGYSGASEATLIKTNAARSRELRNELRLNKRRSTPLQSYQRWDDGARALTVDKVPVWCSPNAWDVSSWEAQRRANMATLLEHF